MTFANVDRVARACALVRKQERESGTAYLIAPDRLVTCEHVVRDALAHEVSIVFEGNEHRFAVRRIGSDRARDVAILELDEAVAGREPLQFSRTCRERDDWTTYGYPRMARWNGVPFSGVVERVNGIKDGSPRLQLYSEKVAAGMGTPINGVSGSPVIVGQSVVGHVSEQMLGKDDRPLFGLVYAVAAAEILALLGDTIEVVDEPMRAPAAGVEISSRSGPGRVRAAVAQLQSVATEPVATKALKAAEALIALGEPHAALSALESAEPNVRHTQLRALALAKTNRLEESTRLLEELFRSQQLEAETGGLLGGRYKQAAFKYGDRAQLLQAYRVYRQTYDRTRDPYPGINVAAVALYLGGPERSLEAAAVARDVAESVEGAMQRHPEDVDHWALATLAEALLLQGALDQARRKYEEAVAMATHRPQDVAIMRAQARRNLTHLNLNPNFLDEALPVPLTVAFTGHMTDLGRRIPCFPETREPSVRVRIRAFLKDRNVRYGVCSAARGSDLIFLDELLKRDGSAEVVLPFPPEAFKRTSVGARWDEIFDRLITAPGVTVTILSSDVPSKAAQPHAFALCNREIERRHVEQAIRFEQRPLLLSVWNRERGETGGTGEFVRDWIEDPERDVVVIAPFGTESS